MRTVNAGNGSYISTRNSNNNGFSEPCFRRQKLPEYQLKADLVDYSFENTTFYSTIPPSPAAPETEQLQESQWKQQLKTQLSCSPELELQIEEHQEPQMLPEIITKNIFNSHTSMFVDYDIPQISLVQSFINTDSSSHATHPCPEGKLLFVDSKVVMSLDQSAQDPSSYGANSKPAPSLLTFFTAKSNSLPDLAAPTSSLEAAVYSKIRIFQLRQEYKIQTAISSHEGCVLASMFLNHSHIPLFRGRSSGGNSCKPPKKLLLPRTRYINARLKLENSSCEDLCQPEWNELELEDSRRIIRIERRYQSNEIVASFSIVGSAIENPQTRPACDPDVKVLEVSCLKCFINDNEPDKDQCASNCTSDRTQHGNAELPKRSLNHKMARTSIGCKYYITSVEVIKIIELLVGNSSILDPHQRRKERGRVRSNLVHFWSKHLVSSSKKTIERCSIPICNGDYLAQLEQNISNYDVRKPRTFDKGVKILEWSSLGSALRRALQSYYMVRLDESSN